MRRVKRTQFWGEDENDDHLILQIIAGDKTATCCPSDFFGVSEGNFHDGSYAVGDNVEVYDLKGRPRCLIEINDIYEKKLGNVPAKLWKGECCNSAEEFLKEHLRCWKTLDVSEDTIITAMHFELKDVFETS